MGKQTLVQSTVTWKKKTKQNSSSEVYDITVDYMHEAAFTFTVTLLIHLSCKVAS